MTLIGIKHPGSDGRLAATVWPIIDSLRRIGVKDLRGLADGLNARGVRTARGGRWHVSNVKNVIDRQSGLL